MTRVDFTSAAQSDFAELMAFYDRQGGTLASDFAAQMESAVARIAEFPDAGTPYRGEARRMLLHRFPVAVVYRTRGSTLEIIALAHHRRRPDYWVLREAPPLYSGRRRDALAPRRVGRIRGPGPAARRA